MKVQPPTGGHGPSWGSQSDPSAQANAYLNDIANALSNYQSGRINQSQFEAILNNDSYKLQLLVDGGGLSPNKSLAIEQVINDSANLDPNNNQQVMRFTYDLQVALSAQK